MMKFNFIKCSTLMFGLSLSAGEAFSHANFDFNRGMTPRSNSTNIKTNDVSLNACGDTPGTQAAAGDAGRLKLTPGQKFSVKWNESINHTAKYRVAFSPDITDDYSVILLGLEENSVTGGNKSLDGAGGQYHHFITVPTTQCDDCSLQFIQQMSTNLITDGNNTKYIGCMDVQIVDPTTLAKPTAPASVMVEWEK